MPTCVCVCVCVWVGGWVCVCMSELVFTVFIGTPSVLNPVQDEELELKCICVYMFGVCVHVCRNQ